MTDYEDFRLSTKVLKVMERLSEYPLIDPYGNVIDSPPVTNLVDGVAIPRDVGTPPPLLEGGLWSRRLTPGDPLSTKGATPQAFTPAGQIRPSMVVRDEGAVRSISTTSPENAQVETVTLFSYTPSHSTGKDIVQYTKVVCNRLLDDWFFTSEYGTTSFVRWAFELGLRDNHQEYTGSMINFVRYSVTGTRG